MTQTAHTARSGSRDKNHDDGQEPGRETKSNQQGIVQIMQKKTYRVHDGPYHFSYSPEKADCLNGGEHKYKLTTDVSRRNPGHG